MNTPHFDEARIPTLHDLVFPGKPELRRTQPGERIAAPLSLHGQTNDLNAPPLMGHATDEPAPQNAAPPDPSFPSIEHTDAPLELHDQADELDAPPLMGLAADEPAPQNAAPPDPSFPSSEHDQNIGSAQSKTFLIEEEVSLEDLMNYLQRPGQATVPVAPTATSAEAPEASGAQRPAESEPAPLSDTDAETIRVMVRNALEQEIEALTDRITHAVIARLSP